MVVKTRSILCLGVSLVLAACTGQVATSSTSRRAAPGQSTTSTPSATTVATGVDGSASEPSQSPDEAFRDGIVPALARLPVVQRVSIVVKESTPEGVWAISEIPEATTPHGRCVVGDRDGRYGTDFICSAEYREILLIAPDLSQIIRAYPLPSQPARLLLVTDEAVYCARQGDGGLPDSMLCRIDRETLEIAGRIFPHSEDSVYGPPDGSAVPHGDWSIAPISQVAVMATLEFNGSIVTTGQDGSATYDPVTLVRRTLEVLEH